MLLAIIKVKGWLYRHILRPVVFLFDSELVHNFFTDIGALLGKMGWLVRLVERITVRDYPILRQEISGIMFDTPVGLSAGFDYEAKMPPIAKMLGFGFSTIGTITNGAYAGNPAPRLGRLVKSRSLLVNKGFKNGGIDAILKKLADSKFNLPIGLSIGKTNYNPATWTPSVQGDTGCPQTQAEAVLDVVAAFKKAESSNVPFSYYELNISCPNLIGNVEFYSSQNLNDLLEAVCALDIQKPIFIKMPISESDEDTLRILEIISYYPIASVIIGNLQKDKSEPSLDQKEVAKFTKGYYSGKPTWARSNELIALAYRNYGKRFVIIGCGGIFSAEDAYTKIRLGASLVQLITGMIYQGPQLILEINIGLEKLLRRDRFNSLHEAVGTFTNNY